MLCFKVMYRRMQQEQTPWHAVINFVFSRTCPIRRLTVTRIYLNLICLPYRSIIISIIVVHGLWWSVGIFVITLVTICVFLLLAFFFFMIQPGLLYRDETDFTCLSVQSPDGCDARNLAVTRSKRYSGAYCSLLSHEVGLRVVPQRVSTVRRV